MNKTRKYVVKLIISLPLIGSFVTFSVSFTCPGSGVSNIRYFKMNKETKLYTQRVRKITTKTGLNHHVLRMITAFYDYLSEDSRVCTCTDLVEYA